MRTHAVVFPFDSFGSGGTAAGAKLLGDLLREIVDDTKAEGRDVPQTAFAESLTVEDIEFDTIESLAEWRTLGTKAAKRMLKADFGVWLSGNHLGVLPLLESLKIEVIQFDAHLDCYDLHDTHTTLSHGNYLRHAKDLPPIIHVGHRDLFVPEKEIRKHLAEVHSAEALALDESAVLASLKKRKEVWLDIDADAFDPSICPAVQSPLPGGLFLPLLIRLIHAIGFDQLRGVSISEFDPGRDRADASLHLLGWLLEWVLIRKSGTIIRRRRGSSGPSSEAGASGSNSS